MIESVARLWRIIREVDERFGFRKLLMYTTYFIFILAIFNWKSIVEVVDEHIERVNRMNHDNEVEFRDELSTTIEECLTELRAISNADRVAYYEFHNSVYNLSGIPFKYIMVTNHVEKYGLDVEFNVLDVNAEVIGNFLRNLKSSVFYVAEDINQLYSTDQYVPKILNSKGTTASCYQYVSSYKMPMGIIVVEYHSQDDIPSGSDWKRIEQSCSLAAQGIISIVAKYKEK